MHVVEINHLSLQAFQASLAGRLDRLRPCIQRTLAIFEAQHALAGEEIAVPPVLQGLPDQFLAPAKPVEGGRVEEIIAEIQRAYEQGLRVRLIHGRAIGMRDVHAAEPDRIDLPVPNASFCSHRVDPMT